ncbi:MAG TPA: ATP-binding protein, partial [Caldilineaceae bacterium]|nr:ATP-binding protein [Caldilineaceae bacterium]
IAQDDLPHIWDRFFQVDHATTRRFGGAGLGLALVKETIEAHGGEVWIDSLAEEGTTVSFSVPVFQPEESTAVETESVSSP